MNDGLYNSYYNWLCDLVRVKQVKGTYWSLTQALYSKPFKWFIPNDDNRACEGINLREQFCEENDIGYAPDNFPETCSMFELIIGLAYRCESIMDGQVINLNMSEWFWKIIENVELDKFTDTMWPLSNVDFIVDTTLERVINRTYDRNGNGGLFPMKRSKKDQRKVELWYQMNTYLVENYYSED